MDDPLSLVRSADKLPPVQDSATAMVRDFCFRIFVNWCIYSVVNL
ncbi:hypothetical protein BROOK1789C_571 [Bathymodiolus brooksi thiotrophic gill symbiont]|nr:hypothetical protein BROOK1789C_571 [Bathymodiolus brooksi thiotrophic gill symbiont]